MERERLGSRLGFILISAGCAIGIGNVWKFPYMVGENGGGIFVLCYLFFLIVLGVPVMTMEFSMGRAAQKSPIRMYQTLTPTHKGFHWHGVVCLTGNVLLLMFYTTVAGWLLQYFFYAIQGRFENADRAAIDGIYDAMLANPVMMGLFTAAVLIIAVLACVLGVQKGLERVTKFMMLALLGLIAVLVVNSLTLDGAKEGLRFYLIPNMESVKEAGGFGKVIVSAMNQAFFTLSIGMGSMAIFGSYLNKDRTLMGEAIHIALLDTVVAVASGLIIFPAIFTFGGNVQAGPPLIFETLPSIFANMPLGRLWGGLFFLFLTFAALSTVLAVFENIVACFMDLGWSRRKACLVCGGALLVLTMPCVLGFNVLSGFHPLGDGSNILDLEDFLVSNIVLPIGSLIFVIYCTAKRGWGFEAFQKEANTGKGLRVKSWMRGYMTYILPVIIAVLFIIGIVDKFFR